MQYVKKTHVQRLLTRDYSVSISERRVSLLRFCDHGLVRIVRDLMLKNILAPDFTSNILHIYYYFSRSVREAQTRYSFDPSVRAPIFNLSRRHLRNTGFFILDFCVRKENF